MDEQKIKEIIKKNMNSIKSKNFDAFFSKVKMNQVSELALFMIVNIGIPVLEQMRRIPPYFFKDFKDVNGIVIPSNIQIVERQAFYQSPLKVVSFEDGCEEIGFRCFEDSQVEKVILPSTINSIPSKCFYNCSELQVLNMPRSITSIGEDAFYNCNDELKIITPLRSRNDESTHIRAMKKDVEFIKNHLSKE